MSQRRQNGGTLGLVAVCCVVVIMVGLGFFFLAQQIGGARELQNATDAGNLNVAKQVLHSPSIEPKGIEATEFGGLFRKDGKVDLENYNRFVGKAMIVAMNAAADSTDASQEHAKAELKMVEGQDGIGQRLCSALADSKNTKGFFENISFDNSLRMLNWRGTSANSDSLLDQVSFMRQPKNNGDNKAPANVYLTQSQLPGMPNQAGIMTSNFKSVESGKEKKFFPFGYTPISIGTGLNVYAVPTRPGEQPHLVSQRQFQHEKTPPLANGSSSFLPPNAFMSNSKSREMHGYDAMMRSSAIVGTLAPPSPAAIPQGYIVIDNTGALTKGIPAHDSDVFTDAIMSGVDIAGDYITQDHSAFDKIKGVASGDVPMALASSIKPPMNQNQLNQLRDQLRNGLKTSLCNSQTAFDSPCKEKLDTIRKFMPPSSNPQKDLVSSELMAVEYLKWEVVSARLFFTETGCGFIDGAPPPTGLKVWNHYLPLCPIPLFGRPGSLNELLVQAGGAEFKQSILTRMHQINPEAGDYESVFNSIIPMGKVSYLFFQDGKFRIAQTMPYSMPNLNAPGINLPDGKPVQRQSLPVFPLEERYINVVGDFGLTHPWDCPAIDDPGTAIDKVRWTPSSGFMNLLGVVKFQNFAHASFKWCCPC